MADSICNFVKIYTNFVKHPVLNWQHLAGIWEILLTFWYFWSRGLREVPLAGLPAEKPVLLTGHSLGGGTATLLGLHLAAAGRQAHLLAFCGKYKPSWYGNHMIVCCRMKSGEE